MTRIPVYWRDWSSDVCSSNLADHDLRGRGDAHARPPAGAGPAPKSRRRKAGSGCATNTFAASNVTTVVNDARNHTSTDRKSGVEGKSADLGGRRVLKKNTNNY